MSLRSFAGLAAGAVFALAACGGPPAPSPPGLPVTMAPSATSGPRALDCDFLLSMSEVEHLIGARVESVRVSYGDGAGCQYQTARGSGNIVMFTGPVAEQMWSDRPTRTPGSTSLVDVDIVDGWPVGHVPGRWVTIAGAAFEGLSPGARIGLVTLLISRL